MRVVLNDYAGHPFQAQLARELADRGHEVLFVYCSTNVTPHGDLAAERPGLEVVGVSTGRTFAKYSLVRRTVQEIRYGLASARLQRSRGCDVVLSSNVPILALLVMRLLMPGVRQVLWLQDIQAGLAGLLLTGPKRILASVFERLEHRAITGADAVVAIAPSMADHLAERGVDRERVSVIENWAPIEDLPQRPRRNHWSARHGLDDAFVFLYSGTIGIKHRPELLVRLSQEFAERPEVRIVAVSEGRGAEWLADEQRRLGLDNLVLLPFQPFAELPDVLASADVLVALLEPQAGTFSIPSKILSYLCAGRALLASLPGVNSAAGLVADRSRSGLVSSTEEAFVADARRLFESATLRHQLGASGRRHAELAFDIDRIADRFVEVLQPAGIRADPTVQAEGVNAA
jgi:colanic acid biosynthesis glycosyl transferase WcaI